MKDLFFYGTLRHLPLLEIVLGCDVQGLDLHEATLGDHAIYGVAEGPFPTIVAEPGGRADGVLLRGLTPEQVARLDFYEGGFAYDLALVRLADGSSAEVYFPQPGLWHPAAPWSLAQWERDWAALSCHAAREVMGYFGKRDRAEVARMFPMIRARAAAKVAARQSRHGAGTLQGRVEIASVERVYANFFALDEYHLSHERFDGSMSETVERAVFIGTDAAIVLPYDPGRDRVLLVEQMRMGPLARGDRALWHLEPVAGRVDPGETPEQCAHREAFEEAGLRFDRLENIAEVYASPGSATDFFHIFLGLTDLPDDVTGIRGMDGEHEDIRSHLFDFEALMELCDAREAADAPLVLSAYWLARHRERLRLDWGKATSEAS
ncbi:NUDIX domain-containing protein [Sulfitobacter aestuarii]|uniref:ADP-ribose pyrophosphatase n=1 Tax=Sulfitobacter aestuarii TaxID=2161676 RepID=A0ABW5U7D2_9RHOB